MRSNRRQESPDRRATEVGASAPVSRRRPRRRLLRCAAGAGLGLCALLIAAILVITKTPLLSGNVVPRLREALNLDVDVDTVYIGWDGRLVLRNATFRLPDVEGEAAEFLTVSRVRMGINWWRSLRSEPDIRGIVLIEPTLRVSLVPDDMSVNIGSLELPEYSPGEAGAAPLPVIVARGARLILAEQTGDEFEPVKTLTINGRLAPDHASRGGYTFSLHEVVPQGGGESAAGLSVEGTYLDGEIRLTVENFALAPLPVDQPPGRERSLLRDLDLKGNIPRATLTYTQDQGLEAELELLGVAMNLPVEPEEASSDVEAPASGTRVRFMRLYDTAGTIRFMRDSVLADVRGLIEDMPYHVEWHHHGLSPQAAFTCRFTSENFRVDRNPALLPYAPAMVVERLRDFSSPMAVVSTTITILRDLPDGDRPGPISVDGTMRMRDGVAAFEGFPYEFHGISGTFEFSDSRIEFKDITGESPSGAAMIARGHITPLDDDAEVDVVVKATGAPIDDALADAFGEGHQHLVPALFSSSSHEQLVQAGLVRSRRQAEADSRELAAVQATLQSLEADAEDDRARLVARHAVLEHRSRIPIFDFGGTCDITVTIKRPAGPLTPWTTIVDIHIPDAGLVPEVFPMPIRARNLTARIENDDGRLTGGTFRTASGATATVEAAFTVPIVNDHPARPEITIRADDLPIDALLINALPGAADSRHKDLLRKLRLSGSGAGEIRISNRNVGTKDEDLGFETEFRFENVSMRPEAGAPEEELGLAPVTVNVKADEQRLHIDFEGMPDAPNLPASAGGPVTGTIGAEFLAWGDDGEATYTADLRWPDMPAQLPIHTIARALSEESAAQITEAQRLYHPRGTVTIQTLIDSRKEGENVQVRFSDARDLWLTLLDHPVRLNASTGMVSVSASPSEAVFEDFSATFTVADAPAGTLALDGSWPLDDTLGRDTLQVELQKASLDAPLLLQLLSDHAPERAAALIQQHEVGGTISARTSLRPSEAGPQWRSLELEPHTLSFVHNGQRVSLADVTGTITLRPDGSGQTGGLSATAPAWAVTLADTAWGIRSDGAVGVHIAGLQLSGKRLSPDLRAILPGDLRRILDELSLAIAGPFEVSSNEQVAELIFEPDGTPRAFNMRFGARFRNAAADAGVSLANITGAAEGHFSRFGHNTEPEFVLIITADSLTAEGIAMTGATARVETGPGPGEISIGDVTADVYEGRLTGTAHLVPELPGGENRHDLPDNPQLSRAFTADLQLAGVRFSPLLAALLDGHGADQAPPADATLHGVGAGNADVPRVGDRSRGVMEAAITLTGTLGDPSTRRGRGRLSIGQGGRVLSLPVVLGLLEVSNLQLPLNAGLDYAHADFYIDGATIVFDDISVISGAIQIFGSGTMTWPDKMLDMRFDTRSSRPIPILSRLVRGIRDELITTTVRGRLGEHEVRLRQPRSSSQPTVGHRVPPDGRGDGDSDPGIAPRTTRVDPE